MLHGGPQLHCLALAAKEQKRHEERQPIFQVAG
jgi:hypothetical protein